MAAKTEEAKAKHRKYRLQWYHDHKSPEQNHKRYLAAKAKETAEQREKRNAKARERRRLAAIERKAMETEAMRLAKKERQRLATIAANKARTKAPEDRAKPKSRAKLYPQSDTPMTPYQAVLSNKRKPGRIVALSGWRGTGF